ncbi:discoidin domain-containing protein [Paenibacillus polymyxa]|uniref:discoidin domain-containing protein n=1 Tax=Paenibacillus TaxID=44249 RepID=UPI000845FFEB|nr:discoidin domain-containing protein [Paenibacillus polymyxa]AOK91042.1 hypothetical protein AOU00_15185 [Paenibacillus polymyxa]
MKKIFFSLLSIFLLASVFASSSFASSSDVNLIPKMSGNNIPSGIASASSSYSDSHQPWTVFDQFINDNGWSTAANGIPGWIGYQFEKPVVVNKYVLQARGGNYYKAESPKDWTFEGWDGTSWIILDTQKNQSNWNQPVKKEFTFSNTKEYIKYRLNVSMNNGQNILTLGAFEMYNTNPVAPSTTPDPSTKPDPSTTPDPSTKPDPSTTPDPSDTDGASQPTGDRAILTVTMDNGFDKEFDLSKKELNAFIAWYDAKDAGRGASFFAIDKHNNNKGPFSNRKDYVIFNKILTFEVSEYSTK